MDGTKYWKQVAFYISEYSILILITKKRGVIMCKNIFNIKSFRMFMHC